MAKGDTNFLSDLNESNLGASKGDGTPSADFEKTFGLEVGRGVYNESGSDALPGLYEQSFLSLWENAKGNYKGGRKFLGFTFGSGIE